jgi:hypothetical protein
MFPEIHFNVISLSLPNFPLFLGGGEFFCLKKILGNIFRNFLGEKKKWKVRREIPYNWTFYSPRHIEIGQIQTNPLNFGPDHNQYF